MNQVTASKDIKTQKRKETPVQIHKGLNRGIYKRYVIKTA
jgi:hypothetical protein